MRLLLARELSRASNVGPANCVQVDSFWLSIRLFWQASFISLGLLVGWPSNKQQMSEILRLHWRPATSKGIQALEARKKLPKAPSYAPLAGWPAGKLASLSKH